MQTPEQGRCFPPKKTSFLSETQRGLSPGSPRHRGARIWGFVHIWEPQRIPSLRGLLTFPAGIKAGMEEESGCSQLERAEGSGMDTPGLGERFFFHQNNLLFVGVEASWRKNALGGDGIDV